MVKTIPTTESDTEDVSPEISFQVIEEDLEEEDTSCEARLRTPQTQRMEEEDKQPK